MSDRKLIAIEHRIDVCSNPVPHDPHSRRSLFDKPAQDLWCLGYYDQKRQGEKVFIYFDSGCWCSDEEELKRRLAIALELTMREIGAIVEKNKRTMHNAGAAPVQFIELDVLFAELDKLTPSKAVIS